MKQQVINYIKTQNNWQNYLENPIYFPSPELRLKSFDVEEPKIIFIGLDPYPRKESAVGISFYDPLIKLQNRTGKKVSIDNLVSFLNLENVIYKDFFEKTQQKGVQWLNLCLTYNPETKGADRDEHIKFWKPIMQYYFSLLNSKIVIVLLGNEAQKLKTPNNFIRVCGKHPSPMAQPKYYNLEQMINEALGYTFDWK